MIQVQSREELLQEICKAIAEHGEAVDLNYIDTSLITDMSRFIQHQRY